METDSELIGEEVEECDNKLPEQCKYPSENNINVKKYEHPKENLLLPLFKKAQQGLLELYELIDDGTESVTNIRKAATQYEIERQKTDEIERSDLEEYIAKKELEAVEEYKIIDEKWDHIKTLKDPLNIHNETMAQREKCNNLLQEKDNVIQFLKETLRKKDELFLNDIEQQGSEVDLLIDRIEQQINTLKEAYINQLNSLEDIIDEEKKLVIDSNREKWKELIQEKDEVNKIYLQKLWNIIDHHEKAMLLSEKDQNENKKNLRFKIHTYINDLTEQNDSLKSFCALSIEKMTYNYQLLLKKEQNHKVIKQHCRKYCARLGTQLADLKKSIEQNKHKMCSNFEQYAAQFDKLNEEICSIDQRYQALALSNAKTYFDLWDFMEKEAKKCVSQIIDYEKILHEEILFIPSEAYFTSNTERPKPPSFEEALKLYDGLKKINTKKPKKLDSCRKVSNTLPETNIKLILDAIRSSCGFLVKQDKKRDIFQLPNKDEYLVELENILEAIGVKTEEDYRLLANSFLPYIVCSNCNPQLPSGAIESPAESEIILKEKSHDLEHDIFDLRLHEFFYKDIESDLGNEAALVVETACLHEADDKQISGHHEETMKICFDNGHTLYINPLDVPRALQNFTVKFHISNTKSESQITETIFAKERISPLQYIVNEEVTEYWESYNKIFGPEKEHLWESMVSAVQQYQNVLHKRHYLKSEMKKLKRSNYELRKLLQRYINATPKHSTYKTTT